MRRTDDKGAIESCLSTAGLKHDGVDIGATPRRTVVRVSNLAAAQDSKEERKRGPPQSRAFEEDGVTPTKAVLGFCKKNGVEPADLEKDGEYVWANVKTVGEVRGGGARRRSPSIIGGLNFPKTMRWCGNDTFSRPCAGFSPCTANTICPSSRWACPPGAPPVCSATVPPPSRR